VTHGQHRRADADLAHLDDLFATEEAPVRPPRRGRGDQPWFVTSGLLAFLGSAVIFTVLAMLNYRLPYPLILAVCVGAVLVRRAVQVSREPSWLRPADLVRPVEVRRRLEPGFWYEGGDGMVGAVHRWDRRLEWGLSDPDRFAHTVGLRIGELVDERLRQRHGITRASDPRRARELLGERVWALLGPMERIPSPRQIAAALTDLDRI
jgi:hypothetical protein